MISGFLKRFPISAATSIAAVVVAFAASVPANAAIGGWSGEGHAKVRLIAAGVDSDGRIAAGIEIVLEPGWKTYWRTPGDAGIAPLVDFSSSINIVGPVQIEYPVPHRYDDGYAISNVYENHVVFHLDARSGDPGSSSKLVLALDIGVCAKICIPEHYDLTLELSPGEADRVAAAILAEARARLPTGPTDGVFDVDKITRAGGSDKRPVFEVAIVAPEAAEADVYVEGPVDWYPSPPKLVSSEDRRATYSVEFSRLGSKTPIDKNEFTVTIVSADQAVEGTVSLD